MTAEEYHVCGVVFSVANFSVNLTVSSDEFQQVLEHFKGLKNLTSNILKEKLTILCLETAQCKQSW